MLDCSCCVTFYISVTPTVSEKRIMSRDERHQRPLQARLQDRVILYLARHEVETVTELSRVLESPRSSTSRATNRLKAEGLVVKVEGKWGLTEEGRAEEERLRRRLPERTKNAKKKIDRIARLERDFERAARLQEDFERAVGSSALRGVSEVPTGLENIGDIAKVPLVDTSSLMPDLSSLTPDLSGLSPNLSGLSGITSDVSGLSGLASDFSSLSDYSPDLSALTNPPLLMDYQVRPFFEAVRLVDSVGVGNPILSSSLESISESVRTNWTDYMASIANVSVDNGLASARVEPLSETLTYLNSKLGEGAFASIQVRAVEDLLNRVPTSNVAPDAFESFMPHMELASSTAVRQILEQADFGTLLKKYGIPPEGFVHSEDDPTVSPGHDYAALRNEGAGASERYDRLHVITPGRDWNDLPEAMKLRVVAAVTFIILHVAFLAAQDQQDSSEYVKDLVQALGGTAATVAICKTVEVFNDKGEDQTE